MKIGHFEFADGARFQKGAEKADPNTVGQHLEVLRLHCKGEITPEDVVADARNDNSPLHSFFQWDDGAAAEQYRLGQARGLIRAVVAVYTREDGPAVRQKYLVHIPEGETSHYRESVHAMSQTRTRQLVIERAWAELVSWKKRHKELTEFAALIPVIDQIGEKLRKARKG